MSRCVHYLCLNIAYGKRVAICQQHVKLTAIGRNIIEIENAGEYVLYGGDMVADRGFRL